LHHLRCWPNVLAAIFLCLYSSSRCLFALLDTMASSAFFPCIPVISNICSTFPIGPIW
jgi:hypothetical protein